MLETIHLEKVFEAVRQNGFDSCELYAENSFETRLTSVRKKVGTERRQNAGLSLRCFSTDRSAQFSTASFSTDSVIQMLSGAVEAPPVAPLLAHGSSSFSKNAETFSQLIRKTETLASVVAQYDDRVKYFEVARMDGTSAEGMEEEAVATFEWKNDKGKRFAETFAQTDIASFWNMLESKLLPKIKSSLPAINPWPMPKGPVPILWSSKSLAKLLLHFLRAFEGDYVVQNLSFLTKLQAILPFSLKETFNAIDCEGSHVKNISFLEGDKKQVACDRWVAEALGVSPTGHSRRASFEKSPTIALWSPEVMTNAVNDETLKNLDRGLHIRDLTVQRSHPSSPLFEVELSDAVLLHHGEEGEPVEPLTFALNCIELFTDLRVFSVEKESTCFPIRKNEQRFVTKITTGAALSENYSLPGSVPPSYYW